MRDKVSYDYPLELIDLFILNETETEGLSGPGTPNDMRIRMREKFPDAAAVMTLGKNGTVYFDAEIECKASARSVNAVDTTAACDTFIGFFLAELLRGGLVLSKSLSGSGSIHPDVR